MRVPSDGDEREALEVCLEASVVKRACRQLTKVARQVLSPLQGGEVERDRTGGGKDKMK